MMRMVRSCDSSQRRLAVFLIVVVTLEVTVISTIIKHEHKLAHNDLDFTGNSGKNNATKLSKNMTTNPGRGVRGQHRTISHFTFGNDEWKCTATYKSDYSCAQTFPTSRTKKNVPQPCAEVIPPVSKDLERGKWSSSTMRDFSGFGEVSRKNVYEAGKSAFKNNKALQSTELGLLQEDFRVPMTTMYNIDFNTNMSGAQMPKCTRQRQELCKNTCSRKPTFGKMDKFVTEAQYAFQWPSSDRLRFPLHVRAPSTSN